jgi:hypothetical protein
MTSTSAVTVGPARSGPIAYAPQQIIEGDEADRLPVPVTAYDCRLPENTHGNQQQDGIVRLRSEALSCEFSPQRFEVFGFSPFRSTVAWRIDRDPARYQGRSHQCDQRER